MSGSNWLKNDRLCPVFAASSLWQQAGGWWKGQQRSRRLALDCHHGCLAI
ncbi:Agamous-like MADS-box protein AGL8 [Zea mays]|uniref:Agamous-like MADS-box protein AGL8 n=1 Tax=Zea mays TaxID=4577 RepID=A0A1D6L4V4_MAIZE|nr:Agamous-like MADS-box protein AGL8 [Zea mays]